jgi:predicted transcriptional regulator
MAAVSPIERFALISIHPRWATAIFGGEKTVELRRRPIADDIRRVVVYATAPVAALVGCFDVRKVDTDKPTKIWSRWGQRSCVPRREFQAYFEGTNSATAIVIGRLRSFDEPISLGSWGRIDRPPQSFQYLESAALANLSCGDKSR